MPIKLVLVVFGIELYIVLLFESSPFSDEAVIGETELSESDRAIYKIKTDGTDRTKIYNGISYGLCVVGDWIYFAPDYIYKIKTDGTSLTKLSNNMAMIHNIEGDWIYYSDSHISADNWYGTIYKIKTDGTGFATICDDKVETIVVEGGFVYYVNVSDQNIYKIKTDGTERTKISNVGNVDSSIFNVVGDRIYYQSYDYLTKKYQGLFKMKTDGTCNEQIYKNNVIPYSLNVVGDWIYYLYQTNKFTTSELFKMKTDGTMGQQVN